MNKNKLREFLGWVCIAFGALASFVVRFLNPDMTQTRLLINFWWLWVGVLCLNIIGFFLITWDSIKKNEENDDI